MQYIFFPTILNYVNGREREGAPLFFFRILAPPPPPPPTPQYLTILMTERGGAIIFCRILAPPMPPPLFPDATIPSNLNDREGSAAVIFVGF